MLINQSFPLNTFLWHIFDSILLYSLVYIYITWYNACMALFVLAIIFLLLILPQKANQKEVFSLSRQKKLIKEFYRHARKGHFKQLTQVYPREINILKDLGFSVSNIIKIKSTEKNLYKVTIDWSCPCSEITEELFNIAVDNS